MNTKQKIIDALGCTLDDLDEHRLLDILLDAYKSKKDQLARMTLENARERQDLANERDSLQRELHRLRCDPLRHTTGEYFFIHNSQKLNVRVVGSSIYMFERSNNHDIMVPQVSAEVWNAKKK